jgi:hypothetical protein
MENEGSSDFTLEDLRGQHTAVLPARDLMIGVSLLGLPLIGVSDVGVTVNTSGPNWLLGSVGSL